MEAVSHQTRLASRPVQGPANYLSLLINRGTMRGFLVFDLAG